MSTRPLVGRDMLKVDPDPWRFSGSAPGPNDTRRPPPKTALDVHNAVRHRNLVGMRIDGGARACRCRPRS